MTADSGSRSLKNTPTWAVAGVCFVFISFSIFIEYLIHRLVHWLKVRRKTALFEAVEKLKSVLILLGFMSLLLAAIQRPVSNICIPTKHAYTMLPCRKSASITTTEHNQIWTNPEIWRIVRNLADEEDAEDAEVAKDTEDAEEEDKCVSKGMTSFISKEGMNQLSIFIFVLAVMQIVYSVLTIYLGRAKMRRWKIWEKETQTVEYQVANDPNRFRITRQTTFGHRYMSSSFTRTSIILWIKCFFRQFFHSVVKVDYLTLRHAFISTHLKTNNSFNFQKYIHQSLQDDFKAVIGISPWMWLVVVIFLLVDVHGWHVYLWVSFLPLIIVLVVGTKLEVIVFKLALKIQDENTVIRGTPLVQPNDNLFWFGHPKYVLTLIHFSLFMNAFEISFFIWVTTQFGINSCYHEDLYIIIIRVALAVTVQVLCSYITLPLYALVTQMGTQFKSSILKEQTTHVIKQWHAGVREKNRKHDKRKDTSPSPRGGDNRTPPDLSPNHQSQTINGESTTVFPYYDNEIIEDSQHFIRDDHAENEIVQIEMSKSQM